MNATRCSGVVGNSAWKTLLQQYVNEVETVDYARWQREQPTAIAHWISQISTLELKSQTVDEQLALWINLYNAFTIDKILEHYPIRSIRPTILGLPNWLAFL